VSGEEREPIDARWAAEAAESCGMKFVRASDYDVASVVLADIPIKFLKEHMLLPVKGGNGSGLLIAVADPNDHYTLEAAKLAFGEHVEFCVSPEDDISRGINQLEHMADSSMDRIIEEFGAEAPMYLEDVEEDVAHLKDLASEAPVIRLVNLVITRAVERRASDIHIEVFRDRLRVRYRIDGVLQEVESPPKTLHKAVISRIKLLAKLNIAERRLPQDGRIGLRVLGRDIEFRVATTPTVYGENLVIRIFDRASVRFVFEELGFPEEELRRFKHMISQPYGVLLVTGPTGSGKSTTLYTALSSLNSQERKIITVEDPVEYRLEGINQIQVNPKINLTFASGLRSIVRMDPDIIMVGEIRDPETAEISVQAALTGHLVFCTLHTNDAAGAIARLTEMGIPNYLIASAMTGILAQRLVRVICTECREEYRVKAEEVSDIVQGLTGEVTVYRGRGCDECSHTGYRGRTGIFELLAADDDIRKLTLANADSGAIKARAVENGMKTLKQDAWDKVMAGVTTLNEVRRVTQREE